MPQLESLEETQRKQKLKRAMAREKQMRQFDADLTAETLSLGSFCLAE
jgi:hypothetical protein